MEDLLDPERLPTLVPLLLELDLVDLTLRLLLLELEDVAFLFDVLLDVF